MKRVLVIGGFGYIGSALALSLRDHFSVDTCDVGWFARFTPDDRPTYDFDAWLLDRKTLERYDGGIVYLAGRSSVGMCRHAPLSEILHDNVFTFAQVLEKIAPEQRFVYASSASVYGNCPSLGELFEDAPLLPALERYDLTKQMCDGIARLSGRRFYGLRFGTVNGWSPRLRGDVMLNKMFLAAQEQGRIDVRNPGVSRPILGMRDLCRAVRTILTADEREAQNGIGIYNLASFNATVRELACEAARILSVPVSLEFSGGAPSSPYDMRISSRRFELTFGFPFFDTVESILRPLMRLPFDPSTREGEPSR